MSREPEKSEDYHLPESWELSELDSPKKERSEQNRPSDYRIHGQPQGVGEIIPRINQLDKIRREDP